MAGQSWIRGKLLGAGAFGSVNLAIHREGGAVFAAKSVVVDANANAEAAVRAIENEIGLLQALDSEYVVRCLGSDWTEEDGRLMRNVFLEYMPEGCLTDFLNQFSRCGAVDEHLIRTYTRSVVEGIAYLHSRDIVHGDIKGKNILVGNGRVKLTDFGSAKRGGDGDGEQGRCGNVSGTPLWMAPEVVQQVEQGPASDVWSLGCTVVEMATGRAPWRNLAGMNQFVALYHIGCTEDVPPVPAWLSPEAHDFLSHCFHRDPRQRWTSSQLLHHPFLTTRFAVKSPTASAPASPASVLHFPDDCELHLSVPTLAAPPSLLKRNLVTAAPPSQLDMSPNASGPWIVVRSPPPSPKSSVTLRAPISPPVEDCELSSSDSCANFQGLSTLVEECCEAVDAVDASFVVVEKFHNGVDGKFFASVATGVDAVLNLDCVGVRGVEFQESERFGGEDFAIREVECGKGCGRRDYLVSGSQYSNPPILVYWWHWCRRRLFFGWKSGEFHHCGILDEYILPPILQEKRLFSMREMCECAEYAEYFARF